MLARDRRLWRSWLRLKPLRTDIKPAIWKLAIAHIILTNLITSNSHFDFKGIATLRASAVLYCYGCWELVFAKDVYFPCMPRNIQAWTFSGKGKWRGFFTAHRRTPKQTLERTNFRFYDCLISTLSGRSRSKKGDIQKAWQSPTALVGWVRLLRVKPWVTITSAGKYFNNWCYAPTTNYQ